MDSEGGGSWKNWMNLDGKWMKDNLFEDSEFFRVNLRADIVTEEYVCISCRSV